MISKNHPSVRDFLTQLCDIKESWFWVLSENENWITLDSDAFDSEKHIF
jgi:hypothetical protein